MRYHAIIFDLDGTLVDTAPDVLQSANHTLRKLGMREITLEEARRSIGPGPDNFARIVLPEGQLHRYDEFIRLFRQHYRDHCLDTTRPFPGVPEVLEALVGVPKAVASNKPREYTQAILQALELSRHFDTVVGPEDVARVKPAPDMLLLAARRLGVDPAQTLMVGDTDNDVLAARSAGMPVCAVTWGYSPEEHLRSLHPDFLIDEPFQLLEIVGLPATAGAALRAASNR